MATNSHSLLLNGSSQYGRKASPTGVFGLTAFTLEGWFNATTVATDDFLFSIGTTAGISEVSCQIRFSGSPVKIDARMATSPTNLYAITSSTTPSTSQWYHVAFTYDGSELNLYLGTDSVDDSSDATPVSATGTTNTPGTSHDSMYMGAIGLTSETDIARHFPGYLDEWRLWDTARTITQINDYRKAQLTGSETNLIGLWRNNDGSGTTSTDSAGSNNFTLTGSPTWSTTVPFTTYTVPTSGGDSNMFLAM